MLNLYDQTRRMKGRIDKLPEDQKQLILSAKREADQFVDGLIETLNTEFDEKEVDISMPKRIKYEYIRQLHKEFDKDFRDDTKVL